MNIEAEVLASLKSPDLLLAAGGSNEAYATTAIAQVLLVMKYVEQMIAWTWDQVPMKTGALRSAITNVIMKSTLQALMLGAPVEYASFVNEFTKVKLSTPGTIYHFYTKMVTFAEQMIPKWYREELRNAGAARINWIVQQTLEV